MKVWATKKVALFQWFRNVLISFKPLEYVYIKIAERQSAEQVYEKIFKSAEWLMLDRGLLTEEEAINAICERNPDYSGLIRSVMSDWYQMLTPMDDVIELVKELKNKGYKIYFLSNYHLLAYKHISKEYSLFDHFDGGIFSFKEKLLKPEPEIYQRLIEIYEIEPGESIFIDDTIENIKEARRCGFRAILFTNPLEFRGELLKNNI